MQNVMHTLASLGLVEARPGVGTFVRARRPALLPDHAWQNTALSLGGEAAPDAATQVEPPPGSIVMHSGYPAPELLPGPAVRAALARAARGPAALTVAAAAGSEPLRAWFATQAARSGAVGADVGPQDVLITHGSQAGVAAVMRAVVGRGRPVLVESPTYWGALTAARRAGAVLIPVSSGPKGPEPDDVRRAFAATGATVFYAQPRFANPTGGVWDAERHDAIREIVRAHGAFLVEDDWARDLACVEAPERTVTEDPDGHVIQLSTLTKSLSPALRVGAVLARGPVRQRILAELIASDLQVSAVVQEAALDVVTRPAWDTHLRHLSRELTVRRDALLGALAAQAPDLPAPHRPLGGVSVWLELPGLQPGQARGVVAACRTRGVWVAAGDEWFPAEPSAQHVRLNFAAADPSRFAEAAAVLGAEAAAAG